MSKNVVQYVRHGSGWAPIGSTIQRLDPGYYEIATDSNVLIFVRKPFTTDSLLRLTDTRSDEVIIEIEHFWTLKGRFSKFGLIHKRGFLLYGPPGSGKTSTIAIVIKKMIESDGIVISGGSNTIANLKTMLHHLREIEPDRHLIVTFEDIDGLLRTYGESTMLSLLDGDANIDNVVFIATTNYPEKLEPRVINRPSRFDRVVQIGMPSRDARRQYILHSDPECDSQEIERWLDLTDDFSVAQLKELIIGVRCFGNSADETVERLRATNIGIVADRKIARDKRNRTFYEKFHEACSSILTDAQIKQIRDVAVSALKAPPINGAAV